MCLRSILIASLLSLAAVSVHAAPVQDFHASGMSAAEECERAEALEPLILQGFVLEPAGPPAVGAVVVSSAGGKAVTDNLGRYRLEARVPRGAESVQLTAVSPDGRNRSAGTSVGLPAGTRFVRVAPLALIEEATCLASWLPTFGGQPGTDHIVESLAVYDDGSGPALYVGGWFTTAGGVVVNHIAKWNGSNWAPLGSGLSGSIGLPPGALDLTVFDDGGGPALYAGGNFTTAGGTLVNHIAKWDGSSWSALGSGMDYNAQVNALTVFDDGGGPALYAGGSFTSAGGVSASNIAKWDGSSWSSLDSGMDSFVFTLAVFDDGGGSALYAGGLFTIAGGVPANYIAKWDGSSWSALGSGMNSAVYTLTVFDDGGGPALYAGGAFTSAGGVAANHIAKWDGASWAFLGGTSFEINGVNRDALALAVFDDGGGPALYAGGSFTTAGGMAVKHIAKWNGSSWSALGSGMNTTPTTVEALSVFDDGGGPALFAGGSFEGAGGLVANEIAKWDGSSWSTLGSGINDGVRALAVFDDGEGPALYAGGDFAAAGGVAADHIAKWDGASWAPLGSGMDGLVRALTEFDDGGGPALYAGGDFTAAGGVAADYIAKWDGSSWSPLGGGLSGSPQALAVFDDGGGPALYAGGLFTTAGGVPANSIARWDGVSWSALGSGMNNGVLALAVFDDGGGPALFAGGFFSMAGGVSASNIAKWDGSSWSEVGGGVEGAVRALEAFDDGSGPALYAGGSFRRAGGAVAQRIARWNGSSWVGSPLNDDVEALAVFDDGGEPALAVGGAFTIAGGVAVTRIAKWDGSGWAALGGGMNDSVLALIAFDDGGGPALYAGGSFGSALDSADSYLAKWGCPAPTPGGGVTTSATPHPQPDRGGILK